jgi:hypothetical protein
LAGDKLRRSEPLDRLAGSFVVDGPRVFDPGCGLAQVVFDLGKRSTTVPCETAELLPKLGHVVADGIVAHPDASAVMESDRD